MMNRRSVIFLMSASMGLWSCAEADPQEPEVVEPDVPDDTPSTDEPDTGTPDPNEPSEPSEPNVNCDADPTHEDCERDYANARDTMLYSYVSGLKLPAEPLQDGYGPECCYDYDGDGEYENALGALLPLVSLVDENLDPADLLTRVFQERGLTMVFAHSKYPQDTMTTGHFDMALYMGASTSSWADRLEGNGEFTLADEPLAEIQGAYNHGGGIQASAASLPLELDLSSVSARIAGLVPNGILKLPLSVVRLNLRVEEKADIGLFNERNDDGELVTEYRGKPVNFLSGGLHGAEIANLVNEIIGPKCALEASLVTFDASKGKPSDEGTLAAPKLLINADMLAVLNASAAGTRCKQVGGLLPSIGILTPLFDIDASGNGVADTLSVGFNIQIAAAKVLE